MAAAEETNGRNLRLSVESDGAADEDRPPPIDQTDRVDVMAAIRELFLDGQSRERDETVREIARALGYRRVGSTINEVLGNDIRTAVRRGILDNSGGRFKLLCRTIDEYNGDHLVEMLLAAMGGGWRDREEAIVAAARHLGFRRTGANIRAAFKSAINAALRRDLLETNGPHRIRKAH